MFKIKLIPKLDAYDLYSAKHELLNGREHHQTPVTIIKTKIDIHYI
jgi:hypothetical protein